MSAGRGYEAREKPTGMRDQNYGTLKLGDETILREHRRKDVRRRFSVEAAEDIVQKEEIRFAVDSAS